MKKVVVPSIVLIVTLLCGIGIWWYIAHTPSHACNFTDRIRNTASNIQLFCFDTTKLPSDVTSDTTQAIIQDSALIFSAKDNTTTIAVSLQKNPGTEKVKTFIEKIIPLHLETDTSIGKGLTGISGDQSITSLSTSSDTWIIITTPKDYDPDRLIKILQAFQQD